MYFLCLLGCLSAFWRDEVKLYKDRVLCSYDGLLVSRCVSYSSGCVRKSLEGKRGSVGRPSLSTESCCIYDTPICSEPANPCNLVRVDPWVGVLDI